MNRLILICILLIGIPAILSGQNINGRLSSSIYTFERFDTVDVSTTHLRAYQTLNLNINKSRYSLRSYLNLESDYAHRDYDPRLRFYHLYFEARNILNFLSFKLGRQPLFNSIAIGSFDGIKLDAKYLGYSLSGYYGGNVPAYQKLKIIDNWEDNYIYGGKFSFTSIRNFLLALSYINKNFKPEDYYAVKLDENLNPITLLVQNKSNQYKYASAEASYEMENMFDVDFRYDYDFNFDVTSKFEFNGRYEQVKNLGVSVYYNYREPRVRYNSVFSVFDYGNTQEIEAGADYNLGMITAVGKFGYVKYKTDNSKRLTLGVNTSYGNISYRRTFGYAGELDAVSLYAARSFMEGLLTPSIGLSFTSYKLSKESETNDLAAVLAGLNIRPWKMLSFDLQGQYLNNKIYENDLRLFFKINYWFNTNLNLM